LCPDDYDTGSQLGDAVEFLDEHPGQMAFITINIGTNDIFAPLRGRPRLLHPTDRDEPAVNPRHAPRARGARRADHRNDYYTPFVADWFDDPAAGQFAAAEIVGFNNFLESLYAGADVPVANVESAFAVTDYTTQADLKGVEPVPSASSTPVPHLDLHRSTAGPRHSRQL
jgi:hypothetical protein